jgi:transcriptional regulator with XRE-family HTH domain
VASAPTAAPIPRAVATDQGPVVQSALLRGELVRLRKESGLTQEQVAADLEWSPSKLIRVEGGRSSITKVDLDALLTKYGVTSESTRERLQALNKGARERAWWDKYRDDISPTYPDYVGFEAGAAFIRQFESGFVPGLLQTRQYAEAVTEYSVNAARVKPIVELRLQRQSELAQRSPQPRRYYVIDEAVIRRHVGISKDPAIMPDQLRAIADELERNPLVTLRVMPFTAGAHRGLSGPFTLLEFDGGLPDVLYIDAGRAPFASMVASNDPRVAEYRDDFETLLEDALPADKSIELIRSVAEEMS